MSYIEAGITELLAIDTNSPITTKEISLHLSRTPIVEDTCVQQEYIQYIQNTLKQLTPSVVSKIISIGIHLSGPRFEGHGLLGSTNTYQPTTQNIERALDFIASLQAVTGLPVWVENANFYSDGIEQVLKSWEHIKILCDATQCGVIVDLAHLVVEANNNGLPANVILGCIPWSQVTEIHLSGITVGRDGSMHDGHNHPIPESVWAILETSLLLLPEDKLANTIFTIEHVSPIWASRTDEFYADFHNLIKRLSHPRKKVNFSGMSEKYVRGYLRYVVNGQIPLLEKACSQRGLVLNDLLDNWLLDLHEQGRRVIFDLNEIPLAERPRCAVLTHEFLHFAKNELRKKELAHA